MNVFIYNLDMKYNFLEIRIDFYFNVFIYIFSMKYNLF